MATLHEITSIQFKADAGKANAAIDSIRQEASKAAEKVRELRTRLEEGKKANLPTEQIKELERELDAADKAAKQWTTAEKSLLRGVKALDQAIIQFNNGRGSVEGMSAALSKAARNAAQLQQSRVDRNSQTWHEMEALILALDKNLLKARQDMDGLVTTIASGGKVSATELRNAATTLTELSSMTARGTSEWYGYQSQLKAIQAELQKVKDEERQLKGEIVTREDAMRVASATDAEATQREVEAAQQRARLARENLNAKQQEIAAQRGTLLAANEQLAVVESEIVAQQRLIEEHKEATASADKKNKKAQEAQQLAEEANATLQKEEAQLKSLQEAAAQATEEVKRLQQAQAEAMKDRSPHLYAQAAGITRNITEVREQIGQKKEALGTADAEQKIKLQAELNALEQKEIQLTEEHNRVLAQAKEAYDEHWKARMANVKQTQALTDATNKEREAKQAVAEQENKVVGARIAAEQAAKRAEAAQKKNNDATAKSALNIEEEKQKLAELQAKREQHAATLQREQTEMDRLTAAANAEAEAELRATQEANHAQTNTIERINQAINVLQEQNKTISQADPLWEENERTIGELTRRLEEMKQKSAELRGETMSLADAEALAATAGKEGFKGTATQLQKAEAALQKALQTAEKGGPEWEKYRAALERVRTEMQNMGMTSERMHSILDNPSAAKNLNELSAAVKRAKAELALMEGTVGKNSKEYANFATQTKKAEQTLKELEAQSKGTASAFDKAWSRLKTYVGLYVGAAVAMQKLTAAMGDLLELSDRMGEVRKTTGFTADEVGRLSNNLAKLDTRTSLTSLMELSSLAGSVGLKTQEQVQGFTEAADQLIVALPELGNESARTIIKIANATGDLEKNGGNVRETLEKVGSTIIALRANSASAAGPITDFVSRVGAVGAQAGISIDQIAALGSTIDALGGRVEMSATALSRMIPAIKNNSFAIANSIGVTEKYLKSLAPMEQMVLILQKMRDNIQHIDTSTEEGMNAMADNVEAFLGKNATMREVMKDLEQQGSRAGIVFGLLSQNVDELQKQLGIASEAYEKNTALANEFANMNETTAAKWERLKNQLEEAFVGDSAQRFLGGIIDGLRKIVDLLTGDEGVSVTLRAIIVYLGLVRLQVISLVKGALASLGGGLKNIGIMLGFIKGEMTALQWSNIFTALAGAVMYAVYAFSQMRDEARRLKEDLNRLADENDAAVREVNQLVTAFNDATKKADSAGKKHEELKAKTEALRKEVDELKNTTNLSAEATETLNKKEEQLKASEESLKQAADESNQANSTRLQLISEINSKYSTYLGYMLSEKTAAEQVASAHQLIIAALKEELIQKSLNRRQDAINNQYDKAIQDYSVESENELRGIPIQSQQRIMDNFRRVLTSISYNAESQTYSRFAVEGLSKESKDKGADDMRKELRVLLRRIVQQEVADSSGKITNRNLWGRGIQNIDDYIGSIWGGLMDDGFGNWVDTYMSREKEVSKAYHDVGVETQTAHKHSVETATKDIDSNFRAIVKITADNQELTDDNIRMLAQHVNGITASLEKYNGEIKDVERYVGKGNDVSLANTVNTLLANLDENTRKRVLDVAQKSRGTGKSGNGTGGVSTSSVNPYGTYNRITDSYDKWDADALVSRRKEMLERVRALANGADVQAVLSEDAKFITEATRNNIKTTRDAIEWYNTERLKIQDALHEKHLTNTGDWMDPTGRRKREKTVKDEWSTYLNELDAYYTERKAKIQEQQNDGEISEAESWRRQLTNEAEWRQRRAELQQLYARKSAEVTEEEQQAIFNIIGERTGDNADFIRASIAKTVQFIYDIGKHSEAEMNNLFGRMDKGSEQDFLRQRNAIGKQMDAIRDIIEKERPFNGITENLQENLTKMGVLFGDMDDELKRLMAAGEDMAEFNAKQEQERVRRLSFLLQEAEHAYNTNIEEVMRHMAEAGMTAWVDYFKNNTDAQNALMAQLHTTFDKVQEAIKKEASLWKKEAENMWNNILLPDGETTLKQLADRTVAALSLDENRVSRANSLIGAGQASERVADRLALQQMKVQLAMQEHYYNIMHQRGRAAIDDLERQAELARERGDIEEATRKELDAQHARMTLNLATAKEETDLAKQREEIIARTEESQNRLYTELKSWADLLTSSLQSVFEATHAGDAEYYNELAKLNLTGKGGPGAGTYIVIDNEGTSDATAHYEYLDEREALERQHEIERENAQAEAWKKVMDDLNMKMSETITDQLNAMLQNASVDANTKAVLANTEALYATSGRGGGADMGIGADGIPNALRPPMEGENGSTVGGSSTDMNGYTAPWQQPSGENAEQTWLSPIAPPEVDTEAYTAPWAAYADASKQATETAVGNNKKIEKSTKQSFAAMTAAANMYGIAYQAMSNENLSTAQKVEMMIVQAAGQAMISMLTASLAADTAKTASHAPSWISKTLDELGPIGGPVAVGVFTALIGGLMGLATSKITKSKSQIAQVTGASSASAGRLSTGMLTYAEGNVNEFTDPSSLTPGKQYNVDAADGRTYRARYMGRNPKTHLTNGPEFHLSGERGREMIIDAGTTRQITMNESEIWHAIQTLSGGGSARRFARRGRGIPAFADGNIEDFIDGSVSGDSVAGTSGMSAEQAASLQASIDRQADLLEDLRINGIKATFDVYGKGGLVDSYDSGKKTLNRYGQRY